MKKIYVSQAKLLGWAMVLMVIVLVVLGPDSDAPYAFYLKD